MKLKTLFLGSAAAFAVVSGAQAADLALAVEPIDYVKVCDAFGTGYYYVPGTDTCLKIHGYVEMDVWYHQDKTVGNIYGQGKVITVPDITAAVADLIATGQTTLQTGDLKDSYASHWEFKSEAGVDFTGKSMSDLGPIVAFVDIRVASDNNDLHGVTGPGTKNAYADSYYGSIGPIMFGYTQSTFDVGGGFTYDGAIREDKKTDQVRLSYLMGTWGIMLGLEDPRDRYAGPKNATGNYPDVILSLTGNMAGLDLQVSGGITDRTSGTGWGVAAAATANLGAAAKLKIAGAYSDDAQAFAGDSNCSGACDDGKWWSAFVSGIVALSGNMSAAATVSYKDGNGGATYTQYSRLEAALGLYYYPSSNSEIGLEVLYKDYGSGSPSKDNWGVHGRFKTSFD
jgi:Porin subfamily